MKLQLPEVHLDRGLCSQWDVSSRREWLATNGLGSFASGTVAGMHTRRYHGLLVAALQPPLGRTLLVSKFEEILFYGRGEYQLSSNQWRDGVISPRGFELIESFAVQGTTPVWRFACADALLEKRVWMEPGANTTYVQYQLLRGSSPSRLELKALIGYRDYHATTHANGWQMHIDEVPGGVRVAAFDSATPIWLLCNGGAISPAHIWYHDLLLGEERRRGLDDTDDVLHAATITADLVPGKSLTVVATTEADPDVDGKRAAARRLDHERAIIARAMPSAASGSAAEVTGQGQTEHWTGDPGLQQLVLAADQFVVRRATQQHPDGMTIIAGYPWFGDWGRDTMIALPGLTLTTGRPEVANTILRTFGRYVDGGMLPNRFPDAGDNPEYNTVDATLWYFEAIRQYVAATGDIELVRDLFAILEGIIDWHRRGTRYRIGMDSDDGLLSSGEEGVQLTWMDAKVGDWVVTPRIGKAVEINALWYNALEVMARFAETLGTDDTLYLEHAERVRVSMKKFWNDEVGYCYDVIDAPGQLSKEAQLRPNQLIAVALEYRAFPVDRERAIVDACSRELYTPLGMRSLAPGETDYAGRYSGTPVERDGAYHQGTTWGWLIGPFVMAHLHVYGDKRMARSFVEPLIDHLVDHGLGTVSEIFDGDPPFTPRGCIAQAWSVAELLRAWQATA
ncbi:MAG: amylo-alpha-1,6-glucosidase [Proteobacteria bacterium]|nr:amylo-alpha-1,6-glucosidase [Pseudomonadota bacterium]